MHDAWLVKQPTLQCFLMMIKSKYLHPIIRLISILHFVSIKWLNMDLLYNSIFSYFLNGSSGQHIFSKPVQSKKDYRIQSKRCLRINSIIPYKFKFICKLQEADGINDIIWTTFAKNTVICAMCKLWLFHHIVCCFSFIDSNIGLYSQSKPERQAFKW